MRPLTPPTLLGCSRRRRGAGRAFATRGFSLVEMLVAVSIFGVVAIAVSTFAVQSSVATQAALSMRDAEAEALELLKQVSRDYVARATGTFASTAHVPLAQIPLVNKLVRVYTPPDVPNGAPADCAGFANCRGLDVYVGDDYYANRFNRNDLRLSYVAYATGCADMPPRYAAVTVPPFCGLACATGKAPVVMRYCNVVSGGSSLPIPATGVKGCPALDTTAYVPVRTKNTQYSAQRALAVGLCVRQTQFALDVEIATYRATGDVVTKRSLNASLPVEPTSGGDVELLP